MSTPLESVKLDLSFSNITPNIATFSALKFYEIHKQENASPTSDARYFAPMSNKLLFPY